MMAEYMAMHAYQIIPPDTIPATPSYPGKNQYQGKGGNVKQV